MPWRWKARGWDRSKWPRRWRGRSAVALPAAREVTASMRDEHSWLLYEIGYWLSITGLTVGFSYRYEGRRNIPRDGPALLLANHQSFFDPSIVGSTTRRHLCFLARKTLFRGPFGAFI